MSLPQKEKSSAPWIPYVLPMALFLVLTQMESSIPRGLYPITYGLKGVLVTITLFMGFPAWRNELRFDAKAIVLGILAGLVGLPLWLGIDAITPHFAFLGSRASVNPFIEIPDPTYRLIFLVVRFLGLSVMVPLLEEIFWRSFLLRYLTDQDRWHQLPIGTFSLLALAIVTGLFGIAHPEYLAGIAFALLMAGLLRQTKSLLACVVGHGVTNFTLGVYVLVTGNWNYW